MQGVQSADKKVQNTLDFSSNSADLSANTDDFASTLSDAMTPAEEGSPSPSVASAAEKNSQTGQQDAASDLPKTNNQVTEHSALSEASVLGQEINPSAASVTVQQKIVEEFGNTVSKIETIPNLAEVLNVLPDNVQLQPPSEEPVVDSRVSSPDILPQQVPVVTSDADASNVIKDTAINKDKTVAIEKQISNQIMATDNQIKTINIENVDDANIIKKQSHHVVVKNDGDESDVPADDMLSVSNVDISVSTAPQIKDLVAYQSPIIPIDMIARSFGLKEGKGGSITLSDDKSDTSILSDSVWADNKTADSQLALLQQLETFLEQKQSGDGFHDNAKNADLTHSFQESFESINGNLNLTQITDKSPINATLQADASNKVVHQLSDKIVWMTQQDIKEARLTLDPKQLGSIDIRISMHHNEASIQFTLSNPIVKDALQTHLHQLGSQLAEAGVMLMQADVQTQQHRQAPPQYMAQSSQNGGFEETIMPSSVLVSNLRDGLFDMYV